VFLSSGCYRQVTSISAARLLQQAYAHAKTCQNTPRRDFPCTHHIAHQAVASCSCMCKDAEDNKTGSPDFHSGPGCTGGQLHIRASRVQVAGRAPPKSPFCSGLLLHLLNHLLHAQKQGCCDASTLHTCSGISQSLDELQLQLQSLCLALNRLLLQALAYVVEGRVS